ncbi:MAG: hypothetical protein PQ975_04900, partial [Methanobacterium sp.]
YESNGYVILKAVGRDDLIFVIDPETGVVRDMNTANGFCGSYCYYDLQTELALSLGNSLVNSEPEWLSRINYAGKKGRDYYPYPKEPNKADVNINKQFLKETRLSETFLYSGGGKIPSKLIKAAIYVTIAMVIVRMAYEPIYKWGYSTYNTINKLIIEKSR